MQGTQAYRELRIIGFAGFMIIAYVSCLFSVYPASTLNSPQYFFISSSLWLFGCWQAWQRLELNRPHPNAPLFSNFGWANQLTILRGGLIALTGGFLLQPAPIEFIAWIPGILYGIAATLDRVDGFVARRTRRTSLLGSELDTVFDALGLLVAPALAIQLGKLHWSFFAVSLAYYLFIAGLAWRRKHERPVFPLLPSKLRRAFAGFQMGFVALVLLPVFSAEITQLLGIAFMLPILLGFMMDWLIVSGRIDGTQARALNVFAAIDRLSNTYLQPGLRVLTAAFIGFFLLVNDESNPAIAIFAGFLSLLFLTGTGARLAALISLIFFSVIFRETRIDWAHIIILFATSWVLLLGPGNYCLWRGDDDWVNRQDGTQ